MAMKSIFDATFRYANSANTDIRKTFARVRRKQRKQVSAGEVRGQRNALIVSLPAPSRRVS